MSRPLFVVLAILLLPLASGAADEKGDETVKAKTAEYEVRRELVEELESVTQHRITIEGVQIPYTAKAGNLVLREEDGKPKGSIFFVAYTRDDVDDLSSRPLTFSFNGGPGSASLWVHLGAFGPKKTELDAEGFPAGPPPGRLVDNPYSVLDFSDLVFIDPVATGFSRAAPGVEAADFHGFQNDIESVGEFIRLYLTRNGRWSSPSSSPAKATAPPVRQGWRVISRTAWGPISTVSLSSPRCSTGRP